jgi:hypothetical protein
MGRDGRSSRTQIPKACRDERPTCTSWRAIPSRLREVSRRGHKNFRRASIVSFGRSSMTQCPVSSRTTRRDIHGHEARQDASSVARPAGGARGKPGSRQRVAKVQSELLASWTRSLARLDDDHDPRGRRLFARILARRRNGNLQSSSGSVGALLALPARVLDDPGGKDLLHGSSSLTERPGANPWPGCDGQRRCAGLSRT